MSDPVDDGAATADRYVLKLFVTGTTPRSTRAIQNLRHICKEHLAGRYYLDVIDIYQHPEAAREHQILAAPTLIKLLPEPVRRVIGDLSDRERVLKGLAILPVTLAGEGRTGEAL